MRTPWTASRRTLLAGASGLTLLALLGLDAPAAAEGVLKVGVLGVMSGPAASWGLVNKYSAEATAQMYNEQGGVEIDGEKYTIEIVSVDDKNDPKLAVSGAERLTQQEAPVDRAWVQRGGNLRMLQGGGCIT